jgi:hypothetical protein
MIYTITEFLKVIKQDMGLRDIPQAISDNDMIERIRLSSLKEFSIRCPNQVEFYLGAESRIENMYDRRACYQIPKHLYQGCDILSVNKVDSKGVDGYANFYAPMGVYPSADATLLAIADYRLAGTIQSSLAPALTFKFVLPDILYIYNGWSSGTYLVEMSLTHDISLSTIPNTAMSAFRQLATLDMKQYFYQTLKRVDNINTGIGDINLKIDEWQSAESEKMDLLKTWDEDYILDVDSIKYF